jgi:two-component system LytT family sensor kinase
MREKGTAGFLWLLAGWMLILLFLFTPEVLLTEPGYLATKTFAVQYGVFGLINFSIFYTGSFFIAPRYFQTKRYGLFIAACLAAIAAFGILKYFIGSLFGDIVLSQYKAPGRGAFGTAVVFFLVTIRNSGLSLLMGTAHRSFLSWILSEKKKRELEAQKHAAEMAFLKMQVNPHFLFNVLNNLFSLATLENSARTADGIMKLSRMIRYMLYEKEDSNHQVSLRKEVAFLNDFIDLVKLRYAGGVNIRFSIEGSIDPHRIPPLILFPLLENACKHGILNDPHKPVCVELAILPAYLSFSVSNYINNYLKDKTGGIGLENVKKRLELLYPGNDTLMVLRTDAQFRVAIKLPL